MPHTIQIKRRKSDSAKELNEIPIKDGELLFDKKANENKLKIGVGTEDSADIEDVNIGGAIKNDGCFVGLDKTDASPTKNSTLITNDKTNGSIILTSDNNTTGPGEIDIKVDTEHDGIINIESAGAGTGIISISATKADENSRVEIKSRSVKLIGTGPNAIVKSEMVSGNTTSNAPLVLIAPQVKHTTAMMGAAKIIIDTNGNVIADKDRDGNAISTTYAKINNITNGTIVAGKATNDSNGNKISDKFASISTDISRVEGKIDGVINGNTTVPKATADANGNTIATIYAKKNDITNGTIVAKNATYATRAMYASTDETKGTIEERLTALGFKNASIEVNIDTGKVQGGEVNLYKQGKVVRIEIKGTLNNFQITGKDIVIATFTKKVEDNFSAILTNDVFGYYIAKIKQYKGSSNYTYVPFRAYINRSGIHIRSDEFIQNWYANGDFWIQYTQGFNVTTG